MYLAHFGLKDFPFGEVSSSADLFESRQLREVLAHFFYALDNHEPFFLLTGDVGTGKSTAVKAILAQIPHGTRCALVSHGSLGSRDFLVEIALKFGLAEREPISKRQVLAHLHGVLTRHSRSGRRAVLILDEAHLLADSCLEEVRLLSNLHVAGRPVLQTCLVGQPELSERLRQEHLRQLRQRIAVRYELKVMDRLETREYLDRRLRVAGGSRSRVLFSVEAGDTIFDWTRGYPREINTLARQALLNAYLEDARVVTREHVLGAKEFGFEGVGVSSTTFPVKAPVSKPPVESPPASREEKPLAVEEPPPTNEEPSPGEIGSVEPSPTWTTEAEAIIDAPIRVPVDLFETDEHSPRAWQWVAAFLLLGGISAAIYFHWFASPISKPLPVPQAMDEGTATPDAAAESAAVPEPEESLSAVAASSAETPSEAVTPTTIREATASQPRPATIPAPPSRPSVPTPTPTSPTLPRPEPVRTADVGNVTATRASENSSRSPRSLAADRNEQGVALARAKALDAAVAAFGEAIELDPSYAEAHYNLGLARVRQGDVEGSVEAFRDAVSIRRDDEDAQRQLGMALLKQGRTEEAVAAFREVIALDGSDALSHHQLALALRDQGALDEAIEEFQRVVALDPRDALAYLNLGITLRERVRTGEAIEAFRQAIELDPRNALAYRNLGAAFLNEKRFDEAIYTLQQALFLTPADAQIHNSLGFAFRSTDRHEAALAAFSKAVELDPNDALAHYNLALILGHFDREEEARQELDLAQKLGYK